MVNVLVVEDEQDLQHVLAYNLRLAGYEVASASTGEEGLRLARSIKPALVLLDLMLPDLPGTEVCRTLKRDPKTAAIPVILLTARGEEIDRVVGFELGADDYVTKPFSVRELVLRVRAVLRRGAPRSTDLPAAGFEVGELRVDPAGHRVWVRDEPVELSALEMRLLVTLLERMERVQTRATLLRDVWQTSGELETRTVDTHVKRLREKLGPAGEHIDTVRGVGYRFMASPQREEA